MVACACGGWTERSFLSVKTMLEAIQSHFYCRHFVSPAPFASLLPLCSIRFCRNEKFVLMCILIHMCVCVCVCACRLCLLHACVQTVCLEKSRCSKKISCNYVFHFTFCWERKRKSLIPCLTWHNTGRDWSIIMKTRQKLGLDDHDQKDLDQYWKHNYLSRYFKDFRDTFFLTVLSPKTVFPIDYLCCWSNGILKIFYVDIIVSYWRSPR